MWLNSSSLTWVPVVSVPRHGVTFSRFKFSHLILSSFWILFINEFLKNNFTLNYCKVFMGTICPSSKTSSIIMYTLLCFLLTTSCISVTLPLANIPDFFRCWMLCWINWRNKMAYKFVNLTGRTETEENRVRYKEKRSFKLWRNIASTCLHKYCQLQKKSKQCVSYNQETHEIGSHISKMAKTQLFLVQ